MKLIWTLRLVFLCLLLGLLAKPVMMRSDPSLSSQWAVLIDSSASMRIQDPESRIEKAKAGALRFLKAQPRSPVFTFSENTRELEKDELESLSARGTRSEIGTAIQEVFQASPVRGVVLFSDGRQVGTSDPVSAAATVGKPIVAVGLGSRSAFRDVAVRSLQTPPFAFKNIQTTLSAQVSAVGFKGDSLPVKLMDGGRVLQIQTIPVTSDEFEATVNFNWTPTGLGAKTLRVEITPFAGEVTPTNNRKEFTLDVGRDKFRVLYICGNPGPEYGFLRYQFKSDPAIELVTFVILRNPRNVVPVSEAELSLIPFPTQDVLISQMQTFDLVVLEDFAFWEYGLSPNLLLAIRKKVEEGGSFLLTGGPRLFSPVSPYMQPTISEMIPLEPEGEAREVAGPAAFVASVPSHPILKIESDVERNKALWASLAPLEAITVGPVAKPGASVLGSALIGGKQVPVLTVWKHGKGRVGVLTTRTTWRWSMVPGAATAGSPSSGGGAFVYQQFWKNMVLWLTHADQYKSVRVAMNEKTLRLGEPATARAWVMDDYFKPLADAVARFQVTGPGPTEHQIEPHAEATGVFAAPFTPTVLGSHTVRVWVTRQGRRYGEDSQAFRVVEGHHEDEDLRPDFQLLQSLADASGGQFLTMDEFSMDLFKEFDREVAKKTGRKVLLWNSPWVFGLVMLFLVLEWIIRKRKGLP